jgi:2-C-methyl-D-erythritol 4-phosphate cytidylyltransferase
MAGGVGMGATLFNTTAIIVAAGSGTRMNLGYNKVYAEICGRPVLHYSIKAIDMSRCVDEIILVIAADEMQYCQEKVIIPGGYSKVSKIVAGGRTRQDSVWNGLIEVDSSAEVVVVHDGARPCVHTADIDSICSSVSAFGSVALGVPSKDTLKTVDKDGIVTGTPDRSFVWAVQTPQAFKRDILMAAYQRSREDESTATDETTLVERMGYPTRLIKGAYSNIKITTREDLVIAERILTRMCS